MTFRNLFSKYDPAVDVVEEEDAAIDFPNDFQEVQGREDATPAVAAGGIGIHDAPSIVKELLARKERFKDLDDKEEHIRLHQALMERCMAD